MKNIFLTGATSGIGEAAAIEFARRGHKLYLTARDNQKARKTEALIQSATPGARVHWLFGDFASLADVRRIASEFLALDVGLDVLFSNAGLVSSTRKLSRDGYEMMFAVNHLAPFLLTRLLANKLAEGEGEARVVVTASGAYKFVRGLNLQDLQSEQAFGPMKTYGHSKLANILFTKALAKKLPEMAPQKQFSINCFHPGFVGTGLASDTLPGRLVMGLCKPFVRSGAKGAETGVYLATDDSVRGVLGGYFEDCRQKPVKPHADDEDAAEALWQASEQLVGE